MKYPCGYLQPARHSRTLFHPTISSARTAQCLAAPAVLRSFPASSFQPEVKQWCKSILWVNEKFLFSSSVANGLIKIHYSFISILTAMMVIPPRPPLSSDCRRRRNSAETSVRKNKKRKTNFRYASAFCSATKKFRVRSQHELTTRTCNDVYVHA